MLWAFVHIDGSGLSSPPPLEPMTVKLALPECRSPIFANYGETTTFGFRLKPVAKTGEFSHMSGEWA